MCGSSISESLLSPAYGESLVDEFADKESYIGAARQAGKAEVAAIWSAPDRAISETVYTYGTPNARTIADLCFPGGHRISNRARSISWPSFRIADCGRACGGPEVEPLDQLQRGHRPTIEFTI